MIISHRDVRLVLDSPAKYFVFFFVDKDSSSGNSQHAKKLCHGQKTTAMTGTIVQESNHDK